MRDNKTSQPAKKYDENIEKTIPFYTSIQRQIIDIIEAVNPNPKKWLDTGCGTGILISKVKKKLVNTHFVLADPSEAMLDIAKEKLSCKCSNINYFLGCTDDLNFGYYTFDVITAILSHHYYESNEAKQNAIEKCFSLLTKGGIYVSVESYKPMTEIGLHIGLERWKRAQLRQGKTLMEVEKYLNRYGKEFFPITINDHISLLREAGFSTVEVFWTSILQVGIYAIK